jgi:hypothetical protein
MVAKRSKGKDALLKIVLTQQLDDLSRSKIEEREKVKVINRSRAQLA